MLLLYPDDETHVNAMSIIAKSHDYLAIQHDRDVWTAEDEKKNPEHKQGTFKKPHFHYVIRTTNQTWNTKLCKDLGIELNYCENVSNFERALQYLIHFNDSDKTEYNIEDTFGTMQNRLVESINKVDKSEGEKVVELINYIRQCEHKLSITAFAEHCARNGYWSEFRRSGAIFVKIIDEHNQNCAE